MVLFHFVRIWDRLIENNMWLQIFVKIFQEQHLAGVARLSSFKDSVTWACTRCVTCIVPEQFALVLLNMMGPSSTPKVSTPRWDTWTLHSHESTFKGASAILVNSCPLCAWRVNMLQDSDYQLFRQGQVPKYVMIFFFPAIGRLSARHWYHRRVPWCWSIQRRKFDVWALWHLHSCCRGESHQ